MRAREICSWRVCAYACTLAWASPRCDNYILGSFTVSCLCFASRRLVEKHVPNKQMTIFIHALAERLEIAPPEMFASEVPASHATIHLHAPRTCMLKHSCALRVLWLCVFSNFAHKSAHRTVKAKIAHRIV